MNVESTIHPQLLKSIATIRSSVDRQAEQRAEMAEESERLSKTLLDSISHEIRTPIAVITTAAGTLNAARDPSLTQVSEGRYECPFLPVQFFARSSYRTPIGNQVFHANTCGPALRVISQALARPLQKETLYVAQIGGNCTLNPAVLGSPA